MKHGIVYNGEQILNVPNSITITRGIMMIGSSVAIVLGGPNLYPALIYAAGAIGDGLDGISARVLKQKTEFGKKLDPFVDATSFVAGLTALTITSPELNERLLLTSALVVQTLYSSHLTYKWKGISDDKKKELGPSIIGKTKTAIMMMSLVKLMGGKHFLEDLQQFLGTYGIQFLEGNLEQMDATLHSASLGGVGIGIMGTLWCWYNYNKKANKILEQK
ncbi:MAG: CDP-alcohol phosphatidyltransferase family protein [Candidatus Gracilibacteria bacterium]|nr:CDP-alcohol phosphatidyltransferase family protein [Candidatus Gracilibacteria bacterium]